MQKVITIYSKSDDAVNEGNVFAHVVESETLNNYLNEGYKISQSLASFANSEVTSITLLLEKNSQK